VLAYLKRRAYTEQARVQNGFITYLYRTGIKETSTTAGFLGAQILNRDLGDEVEITLLTYWENVSASKHFMTKI